MTEPAAAESTVTFASLGLSEELVARLAGRAMTVPTPVQAKVIPIALAGGDILAQARTGSGKTLAFLLPLATLIARGDCARAWVVCPTRELAQQCAREAGLVLGEAAVATLIGGSPFGQQLRELSRKPKLVVGTPGRMCDHLSRGALVPDAEILVLDEADQMLDMGFKDELDTLVKDLGTGVARWLFSATFPPVVQAAVDRWLEKPREVRLDVGAGSSHVPQKYVVVPGHEQDSALARLLHVLEPGRALVFSRTRIGVDSTVQNLAQHGIEAAGISGDLTQDARERVLAHFRSGKLPVLVATDVAARGLDVKDVTHVFNLGLPMGAAAYTHRVGRTARAGAAGEAWTLVGRGDVSRFLRMAQMSGCKPQSAALPTPQQIAGARRQRLAARVAESLGEGLTLPAEFAALVTEHGAEAVLAAMVHRLVPEPPPAREPVRSASGSAGGRDRHTTRLVLDVGDDDLITPAAIIATVCRAAGVASQDVGKITILPRQTLLDASPQAAARILAVALHYRGRTVHISPGTHGSSTHLERPRPAHRETGPRDAGQHDSARDAARRDAPNRDAGPRDGGHREPLRREPGQRDPRSAAPRPTDHRPDLAPFDRDPADEPRPVRRPGAVASPLRSAPPLRPYTNEAAPIDPHAKPMTVVRIALGRRDGLDSVRPLIKAVCRSAKVSKNAMGGIGIRDDFTEIELRPEAADILLEAGQLMVEGKPFPITRR